MSSIMKGEGTLPQYPAASRGGAAGPAIVRSLLYSPIASMPLYTACIGQRKQEGGTCMLSSRGGGHLHVSNRGRGDAGVCLWAVHGATELRVFTVVAFCAAWNGGGVL